VILQFLTNAPAGMTERSAHLRAKTQMGEVFPYTSPLVITEIIWVPKSFYGYFMRAMAHVIISLVLSRTRKRERGTRRRCRASAAAVG
jgi:hypothetical protein